MLWVHVGWKLEYQCPALSHKYSKTLARGNQSPEESSRRREMNALLWMPCLYEMAANENWKSNIQITTIGIMVSGNSRTRTATIELLKCVSTIVSIGWDSTVFGFTGVKFYIYQCTHIIILQKNWKANVITYFLEEEIVWGSIIVGSVLFILSSRGNIPKKWLIFTQNIKKSRIFRRALRAGPSQSRLLPSTLTPHGKPNKVISTHDQN